MYSSPRLVREAMFRKSESTAPRCVTPGKAATKLPELFRLPVAVRRICEANGAFGLMVAALPGTKPAPWPAALAARIAVALFEMMPVMSML